MKKKIIIIGIIVIVCGAGILLWLWLSTHNSVSPPTSVVMSSSTLPNSGTLPTLVIPANVAGDAITIGTSRGTVTVKNFYKTVVGMDEEFIIFQKSSGYEFLYDTENGSFVVSVDAGPLSEVRPAAETAFLQALGIGEADACKLTVIVGVDSSVDASLAGKALPLSFCVPGAFGQ